MSLIKWNPFLSDGFAFDDTDKILGEFLPAVRSNQSGFTPALDIYEDKDNIIVETQLAGIDPEKVSVSIEDNVLYIKGESERKSEVEEKNYYRKEVRYGSFYRSVTLPADVIGTKAEASYKDGVLKIEIPKAPEKKEKKLKIKVKSK